MNTVVFFNSLGFGSPCYLLTLLQLDYLSRRFITYLRIIYETLLYVSLSGVRNFPVIIQGLLAYLCSFPGHNISNYFLVIALRYLRFIHTIEDFLGRISGANTVHKLFLYYVYLYFYSYIWLPHCCLNIVTTVYPA